MNKEHGILILGKKISLNKIDHGEGYVRMISQNGYLIGERKVRQSA